MTLQEIRTTLESKAQEYNAALTEKQFDKLPAITTRMDELVSDYAKKAKAEFLEISHDAESPLNDALTRLTYTVIAYKDNTDKETQAVTREVTEKVKQITLADCFGSFPSAFHSNIWMRYVEKYNQLLCLNVADEIGATEAEKALIRDKFAMKQASRELDLGKPSNTQLLKQLQTVIDQIYYEEEIFKDKPRNAIRVTSHDINFLQRVYTKMGRQAKNVSTLNSGKLANVLAQVLNKLITGTAYGVEFKTAKEAPAAGQVTTVKEAKPKKDKKNSNSNSKSKKETGKPVPEAKTEAVA